MKTDIISMKFMRPLAATAMLGLIGLAAGAEGPAAAGWSSPLAAGYLHRASTMLATGNPLGTLDQTSPGLTAPQPSDPAMKAEWLALRGAAQFERGDADCLATLRELADRYPDSPLATQAILTIGDWHWLHADWHAAIGNYLDARIQSLPDAQRALYSYRLALAWIKCGVPENATPLLASIAGNPEYAAAARYYSAYISYLEGDLDRAYTEMKALQDVAVEGIEPLYYMAQIEYRKGKYDDVATHAESLIRKRPVEELLPEAHRIAGLSRFKLGDTAAAGSHLRKYLSLTDSPNDDALYAMGAILYGDGMLEEAETLLQPLTTRDNDLAQGAYLYIGQIAEQRGDNNAAAMAFGHAASMAYDRNVAETALYNRITALTHGGNSPFASTITLLEDFLEQYPDSPYAPEVEESLATAFFHESDYAKALAAIDRIPEPTEATLATRQKILYRLGMGELSAGDPAGAASHLREAAGMQRQSTALAAEARLWLGEALYASGSWKEAAAAYQQAMKGKLSASNRLPARYGLAYSLFQAKDWKGAAKAFAEITDDRTAPAQMRGDALIREGDCMLYTGQYAKAAEMFQRASREGNGDADYAAFRHATVMGLTSGADEKMSALNAFLKERPDSKWTPDVLLEAGNTMAALDRPDKAASYFERLSSEYPKDSRSRSGSLSLALSYAKQGLNDKAETAYKKIILQWPTSEEASLANDDMRRITASEQRLTDYAEFLSGIEGAPQIDPDEMDAITFESAETAYADNPDNTAPLERYVEKFPDGRYLANALMDLAEAADFAGQGAKALPLLETLLTRRADSPQVPAALFLQARLLEEAGNGPEALKSYLQLAERGGADFAAEAMAGAMRTASDPDSRAEYARRLLQTGGATADDADDARFHEAAGRLRGSDPKGGESALKLLAQNPDNLSGAKAAVELGEWYVEAGNPKQALQTLEAFTDAGSLHSYWLARGFIALADAYHADGNDYLAREYLKSLRENYPGDEANIRDGIASRLNTYNK